MINIGFWKSGQWRPFKHQLLDSLYLCLSPFNMDVRSNWLASCISIFVCHLYHWFTFAGAPVVGTTRTCSAEDFSLVTLQEESEDAVINTIQSVLPRLNSMMDWFQSRWTTWIFCRGLRVALRCHLKCVPVEQDRVWTKQVRGGDWWNLIWLCLGLFQSARSPPRRRWYS